MAKIDIPCLVARTGKTSGTSWYWQPSKTLRAAGFAPEPLGKDEARAVERARELNAEVERWKIGGELLRPTVKPRKIEGTLGALIARYRREVVNGTKPDGSPRIAASTARTYNAPLDRLDAWAGGQPLAYITPPRVKALRNAMMQPALKQPPGGSATGGGIGHHAAHNTLRLGRQLFAFAIEEGIVPLGHNPFVNFGLAAPPPRDVIWSAPARELIIAAADAAGMPSLALAIMLGYAIGQREADVLELGVPQFVAIPEHKMQPEDYATLSAAAPDGVPRGIRVRQNKTGAWIEVPIVGEVRRRVEANIARAKAASTLTFILDDARATIDYTGRIGQGRFQRDFATIREAAAVAAMEQQQHELAAEIRTLEFRDLRRTCVVYLGELGFDAHLIAAITGHDIDETQRILKTYMPRTTGRAAHVAARVIAIEAAREAKGAKDKTA